MATRNDPYSRLSFIDNIYGHKYIILFNVNPTSGPNARIINECQRAWGVKVEKKNYHVFYINDTQLGACICHKGNYCIVFNKKAKLTNRTLVHECAHAAVDALQWSDYKIDKENDEPFAYYISWLVNEITEHGNSRKLW